MLAQEHAHHGIVQYPVLQEVLQPRDPAVRAAVLQAIIVMLREMAHEERRQCAKIALHEGAAASDRACQAIAERIATEILARDAQAEADAS
jgi:hypothetical protein